MKRLLVILLLLPLALHAQPRPRKVFISVDMEGISGVVQPAQLGPGGFEYQSARDWMTGEVNAAIAGIREAGPAEIVVCDSHGNGQNVLIDKLPEECDRRDFPGARDDAGIDDRRRRRLIGYTAASDVDACAATRSRARGSRDQVTGEVSKASTTPRLPAVRPTDRLRLGRRTRSQLRSGSRGEGDRQGAYGYHSR